jgi:ribonuclease HII
MMAKQFLIGIDEAGRGPLAGPISVGAFSFKDKSILKKFKGVKDSKQLSEKQREEWFSIIKRGKKDGHIMYAVSFSSAAVIDTKGLTHSTNAAMNRCLKRLEKTGFAPKDNLGSYPCKILLDGSLYAPSRYKNQKTIIDGDAKEPIIALASICAKVLRDRKMKRLAKKFPHYGFEIHKGYGTKAHYRAIKKYGISPIHRRSFLKGISLKSIR